MRIDHSDEQKALRKELRDYFSELMTPERLEATRNAEGGAIYKEVIRELGKAGWLAIGWPKEYGGHDRSNQEQLIFFEEAQLASVPLPFVTINTVAPALMTHGSDAHKAFFLPKIAAGELHFAIGYTESNSGTDLASLTTAAEKKGSDYIINGTKVFTSGAESADYIWLATRTDKEVEKPHKGITIFMVDAHQPGFSYAPIHTVGDVRTNMSYYHGVICPESMIAGELNGGWKLITSQLNHERIGLAAIGIVALGLYQRVLDWSREDIGGSRPLDTPWIQQSLAQVHNRLEAMRLMNWRMAWLTDQGQPDPAFASAIKAYSTECLIEVYRLMIDVVGSRAMVKRNGRDSLLTGDLETEYRKCQINTFGGGVAEVMRDLIAGFGLGMRAYKR